MRERGDSQQALLAHWQAQLGLCSYRIELEWVSIFAVYDELCRVGNSLVGVVCDHERREATIFHTRRLTRADVAHELLHVKHPDWSEAEVNAATDRLLAQAREHVRLRGPRRRSALTRP